MTEIRTIGIIGAGKLGMTLARIARHYGFDVNIAGSGKPEKIALSTEVLAPGAKAMPIADVTRQSDIIILALPLGKFRILHKELFVGKLVIDAMNYWWEVDGDRDAIVPAGQSSSEAVQEYLEGARVVKAFSHMGYHDLFDEHKPRGSADRKAIAIAGDDQIAINKIETLIDGLRFDPVHIGALATGRKLEPGTRAFGANVDANTLRKLTASE